MSTFRAGPGYADVGEVTIDLDPVVQGRGQGAALMQALEALARQRGLRVLVAAISGDNAKAQRFHGKAGFVKTGHMSGIGQKFGRRFDLVLMQKEIPAPD